MKKRALYQLKITLHDIDPPVWRRVQVWEDTKLPPLHRILQSLFNWEGYHLHEFRMGRRVYAEPDPEDHHFGRKTIDERAVPLNALIDRVGDELEDHYDFGDNWRHYILLEAILLPEEGVAYPRCVAGERNGPPEDSGGPFRYADYLEALRDPDHPEHENLLQWRGPFDPDTFSRARVNAVLNRTFQRRPKR